MIANPEVKAFRYDPYSKVRQQFPLLVYSLAPSPGVESGVLRPRVDEEEQAGGHPAGQGDRDLGAHTGHPGQVAEHWHVLPLSGTTLSDTALSDIPLSDILLSDIPLSDIPLSNTPLSVTTLMSDTSCLTPHCLTPHCLTRLCLTLLHYSV